MILPALPTLTGAAGASIMLAGKVLAAIGFMAAANVVILYAS